MSVFNEAIRNFLSPINQFLDDEKITEIMINGPKDIFIEKDGVLIKTPAKFHDEDDLRSAVRAIAQSVGRIIDNEHPYLDAYMTDGSRVAVIIPPLAKAGTIVTIRKFSAKKLGLKDLIDKGSLSKEAARFLDICVYLGKNILVSGGTGSGKTTMLNVLGQRIPAGQRLITIEDSLELQIDANHVVNLVSRKADPGKNLEAITIRNLVHSAMRMRPDRLVVGEVRGDEALDLVQVMNTGHHGSMGTIHANNPKDACIRLEMLCLLGDTKIPAELMRLMISSAVQVIVHCERLPDGSRRTLAICELLGLDALKNYVVKDIFRFVQKNKDTQTGKIEGEIVPCDYVPSFFEEIRVNKLPFPKENFQGPSWVTALKKSA
ncbi:MAG: ATPase, T2SS/T4P/T4SS family [Bacteriovoracaceae bacterium]|nr:ATPase, T2SS/T4P/T4SS family [Bacteriovoracaceae bacterium]